MAARNAIAIDLGRHRLRALYANGNERALRVRALLDEPLPAEIDREDADALGRWVGETLRRGGFPRGPVTLALGREHVCLKRLMLPSTDSDELPGMASLALRRELAFDPDQAVIDYVPIEQAGSATSVIAAAVPAPVLEHRQRVMRAAGRAVERVGLRSMGIARLRQDTGHDPRAATLVIDCTGGGVEFSVVVEGSVIFARGTDLPGNAGVEDQIRHAITETRRTWTSYRIGPDAREMGEVLVVGARDVTEQVIEAAREIVGAPAGALAAHALVDAGSDHLDAAWPLAGLLLEQRLGDASIDFAHPRRAPDRAAHTRQRVLLAAAVVVFAAVGAAIVGNVKLRQLAEEYEGLREQASDLAPKSHRFTRDVFKLKHLEHWENAGAGWLEHALYLQGVAPPPAELVLDGWSGTLNFTGVDYDKRAPAEKRWSAPWTATIILAGEARDRATADRFRDALVEDPIYTADTDGSDGGGGRRLPVGFTYRLRSDHAAPARPAADETATASSATGGRP